MVSLFKKFWGGAETSSAQIAKERLRLVIKYERTDISPLLLENLRVDIISVLKNYMEIDEQKIEINLDQSGRSVALNASIPILKVKRQDAGPDDRDRPDPASNFKTRRRR